MVWKLFQNKMFLPLWCWVPSENNSFLRQECCWLNSEGLETTAHCFYSGLLICKMGTATEDIHTMMSGAGFKKKSIFISFILHVFFIPNPSCQTVVSSWTHWTVFVWPIQRSVIYWCWLGSDLSSQKADGLPVLTEATCIKLLNQHFYEHQTEHSFDPHYLQLDLD